MGKKFGLGNVIVISLTVIVFAMALFLKGFTHDILLEIGVLLVSTKLIIMNNKISLANQTLLNKMNEVKKVVDELKSNKDDSPANETKNTQ